MNAVSRYVPNSQSAVVPDATYRSLACIGLYPFRDAIALPIVTSAARSWLVMSDGRLAVVAAYGHIT